MLELLKTILPGLLCMAAGYVMIFRPDIVWKIEHIFSQKPYDPGKSYPKTMQTVGTLFVIMGIYMTVFPILGITG